MVTLTVVADPFGDYDPALLAECFPAVMRPFKRHFVVELGSDFRRSISENHKRNIRKSKKAVDVENCRSPGVYLDDWKVLYGNLVARHGIKGLTAFSDSCFDEQFKVPGMVCFRAIVDGRTAGMVLWYTMGDRAYYHLGAYSESGYDAKASFAIFSVSLDYFAGEGLKWVNLGAGAGVSADSSDGLTRFKAGWATGTRDAYLCGRILDEEPYARLCAERGNVSTDYFPAYRVGEFT
jgi:hypothetical protein